MLEDAREEARERVNLDIETDIQGFDIDAAAIKQHAPTQKWQEWTD